MTTNSNRHRHEADVDPSEADLTAPPLDRVASTTDEKIALLEASAAELQDRWVRSEAENANIRVRAKRDVEEAKLFAVEKFALDVVEAAENLRRGLERLPPAADQEAANIAGLRSGLVETERGFVALLERHGIKRVDPIGTAFDPNFHQAMAEQASADHEPGTIVQTLSPTWTLNGRLLRAAMVIVARAPSTEKAPPS